MKNILSILLIVIFSIESIAQIGPVFSFKKFLSTDQPYIETYMEVYANTLKIQAIDTTQLSYGVEVVQLLKN